MSVIGTLYLDYSGESSNLFIPLVLLSESGLFKEDEPLKLMCPYA